MSSDPQLRNFYSSASLVGGALSSVLGAIYLSNVCLIQAGFLSFGLVLVASLTLIVLLSPLSMILIPALGLPCLRRVDSRFRKNRPQVLALCGSLIGVVLAVVYGLISAVFGKFWWQEIGPSLRDRAFSILLFLTPSVYGLIWGIGAGWYLASRRGSLDASQ